MFVCSLYRFVITTRGEYVFLNQSWTELHCQNVAIGSVHDFKIFIWCFGRLLHCRKWRCTCTTAHALEKFCDETRIAIYPKLNYYYIISIEYNIRRHFLHTRGTHVLDYVNTRRLNIDDGTLVKHDRMPQHVNRVRYRLNNGVFLLGFLTQPSNLLPRSCYPHHFYVTAMASQWQPFWKRD